MHCEQAINLISAQLDREISAEEQNDLAQHLCDCSACRATLEAFSSQDHELRQTFEPRRQAVRGVVAEVNASLETSPPAADSWSSRYAPPLLLASSLAAAVLVIAALAWHPFRKNESAKDWEARIPGSFLGTPPEVWLTPRPQTPSPLGKSLKVGDEVKTRAGERQRLTLPDRSVLFVNQETAVRVEGERLVSLDAGSVYLEVAPMTTPPTAVGGLATFVVKTPAREVKALGTHFSVAADPAGTEVLVTQGKVQVSGVKQPLLAGQRLERQGENPVPAPRSSHLLEWTRDLVAAAESPLVPGSQYSGGALIAVDQSGQQARLSLRKYHVDVHIEDGFARTTIDQTYFNHHPWRLEGTFYFPLPPDASLSRLAMYVDGNLMEGGMAERDYARAVYEKIVRSQRDPALLEWVDGSTFKMRVFPLEGRQEKRIILSYSQRLPTLYGKTTYRFPAGHNLQLVNEWSFNARLKQAGERRGVSPPVHVTSPTHPGMSVRQENGDLVLHDRAQAVKVDRDVVLELTSSADVAGSGERIRLGKAQHENNTYLMLRYRPELPGRLEPVRRDFLFLFESSADRDPLLARTQIEVLRSLLNQVSHEDTFNIVTAGTLTRFWSQERKPVTPENIMAALDWLERTHLIGALDLGEALRVSIDSLTKAENPHLVHLGSGLTGLGVVQDELLKMVPPTIRYVGIGVGKRWARSWMKQAAEKTGGLFTQINPDESVGWRAFDLLATLNTPRLLDVRVEARVHQGEPPQVLVDNPTIAQGEELFAVTRCTQMPETLIVTGLLEGKPFRREVPVRDVEEGAGYLPRTWARLEIDRLLAADATANKKAIIELSKAMYVMTPYTSLLVLENEAMYREHQVDRGRKDHWAMYPCPPKIPVVYEPDPTLGIDARNAPRDALPNCEQVMQTVLVRTPPHLLRRPNQSSRQEPVRTALQIYQGAIAWSDQDLDEKEGRELERLSLGDREDRVSGRRHKLRLLREPAQAEGKPRSGRRADLRWFYQIERMEDLSEKLAREETPEGQQWELGIPIHAERAGVEPLISQQDPYAAILRGLEKARTGSLVSGVGVSPQRAGQIPIAGNELGRVDVIRRHVPSFVYNPTFDSRFLRDPERLEKQLATDLYHPILGKPPILGRVFAGQPELAGRRARSTSGPSWTEAVLYQRLLFTGDERLFTDLVSYAPGLNSSQADIQATMEAEASPDFRTSPGKIDPAARHLIDRARQAGWQTLTLGGENGDPEVRILFDGGGRYRYEQTLPSGLREVVLCDGKTLWHLYPEIGLAGQRNVSRFHRAQLAGLMPWLPFPAEDLARGADLVLVNAHTIAIAPHALKDAEGQEDKEVVSYRLHLVFGSDGRLAERQLVEMPAGRIILRETYAATGLVRLLNAEGKELLKQQHRLSPAQEPVLKPDLASLVVVPLPLRTRDKVFEAASLEPGHNLEAIDNSCFRYVSPEQAVSLLATLSAQRSEEARFLLRHCVALQDDLRSGHFVLLASAGFNLLEEPEFREMIAQRPDDPLLRFLALVTSPDYRWCQSRLSVNLAGNVAPETTFLGRLARFADLALRWSHEPWRYLVRPIRECDAERSLAFIRRHPRSPLALAILAELGQRGGFHTSRQLELAKVWEELSDGGRDYEATYEQARCLYRAGHKEEARKLFLALYERTLELGELPVFDSDFYNALVEPGKADDPWMTLLLKTANRLIEEKRRPTVVLLAHQARAMGDLGAFDNLLTVPLAGITEERDRLETYLAAIQVLMHHHQDSRAEKLVLELLDRQEFRELPGLWRLAGQLAERQGQESICLDRLERALDLEYADLPEVINLVVWRRDYRRLLDHYLALVPQLAGTDKAKALVQRTIQAADRWRAHDPEEGRSACDLAGQILKRLGQEELAWEYLTSPIALQPEASTRPADLAAQLNRTGDYALADRAYATAFRSQPQQGHLLWDRAMNLIQAGKRDQGRQLLQKLIESKESWPQLKQRAQWALAH